MLENYNDVLTAEELIEILRISRGTVYSLLKSNTIKSIRIGHTYRVPKQYLREYLGI